MHSKKLLALTEDALAEVKARDVRVLDVHDLTPLADYMVIASGTSDRHVKSLADHVISQATAAGWPVLGIEGREGGEWVLVDLRDVVVHIMQPKARDFYKLESLWDMGSAATA
ncbi:MAG: ribosome silencing factor [Chromatiales bacterium]|nr:ribosome silencing factor [Chromatiales bacterium]